MRIGIDVSQLAYSHTGVANYLLQLLKEMVKDEKNEYILFFSSLRQTPPQEVISLTKLKNVTLKKFRFPPTALHILWNIVHLTPIEKFVGPVDIFITSDWTEPPAKKAKKATILYDLIVYKYPRETADKIIKVQKKKLSWVAKESDIVFCISESTKTDAEEILHIDKLKLKVVYPGF